MLSITGIGRLGEAGITKRKWAYQLWTSHQTPAWIPWTLSCFNVPALLLLCFRVFLISLKRETQKRIVCFLRRQKEHIKSVLRKLYCPRFREKKASGRHVFTMESSNINKCAHKRRILWHAICWSTQWFIPGTYFPCMYVGVVRLTLIFLLCVSKGNAFAIDLAPFLQVVNEQQSDNVIREFDTSSEKSRRKAQVAGFCSAHYLWRDNYREEHEGTSEELQPDQGLMSRQESPRKFATKCLSLM